MVRKKKGVGPPENRWPHQAGGGPTLEMTMTLRLPGTVALTATHTHDYAGAIGYNWHVVPLIEKASEALQATCFLSCSLMLH